MSVTSDSASELVLPDVIEALQRLQQNPDQLARERDQRYEATPPPYMESREASQPSSPYVLGAVEEMWEEQRRLREIRNKSKPVYQFKTQAQREKERLHDQRLKELYGRRPTLPFDEATDYKANAENNVRARWVEQGIWGEEWGPAWLRGIRPLGVAGAPVSSCDGPFYNQATPDRHPGGSRWGHERGDTPSPSPSPPPTPPRIPDHLIVPPRTRLPSPPPPPPRPRFQVARVLPDDSVILKVPKPTVRDPEASRPLHQFLYQVAKEREWIRDETAYKMPGRAVDLDSLAYQSVRKNWINDGIWSPKWEGELPGPSWYHEEPESWGPVDPQRAPPTRWTERNQRPPHPNAIEPWRRAHWHRHASPSSALDQSHLPVPASASEASNHAASNTSNEAVAPHAQGQLSRQARDTLAQQAVAPENVPSRAQEPRQSLRDATTTRPDNQDGAGPSNTQARRTRPKRNRSDDTAESEQPAPLPKRAKKSGGGKGRASTANDGPAETTSDPRENLPAGRKMGAQGARTMESKSNGDSQKGATRRSARIANRQAQAEAAAANLANMTPAAPASSRPRAAGKGKATSSDTQVMMAPKGGKKRRHRR
ncbi:unnamed protein product [Clonostachys rhizophaga]|uniref:Uncharacterized protein n=1 Tax=Clonostachys rhizophaga TaxID=160324 RepID=A0A9N9VYY2_9HYPO|nr:unnamed protein product [Clonostachys rhizophaga]